jgi:hypothetical protein
VRVLTEAERPLGARTVVVQLLKTARMRIAANVGTMIAFISCRFSSDSEGEPKVSVSEFTR